MQAAWERLVEAVALLNDNLLEDYLEFFDLDADQVREGMRSAVERGLLSPILYTSAKGGVGVEPVLDTVVDFLPNPHQAIPAGSPAG